MKRGDPDYPPLLVMQSYFGQHRMSGGRLFQRIRENSWNQLRRLRLHRVFPARRNLMEPPPNVARSSQAFQVWIRPAEPPQAAFTLRLAVYELNKLIKEGIPQADFDAPRSS